MIDFIRELKIQSSNLGVEHYVEPVLNDPSFSTWSGSGKPIHHHYGDGGLVKHTYEVWMLARSIREIYRGYNVDPYTASDINLPELFISVIWHDYGKIWDYQKDENGVWGKHDNHARQIHHISRSAIEWNKHYEMLQYDRFDFSKVSNVNPDNVTHNILSHHGMREWGSPVAPATREAWILHLADNMSAKLDDCDKHDRIKV